MLNATLYYMMRSRVHGERMTASRAYVTDYCRSWKARLVGTTSIEREATKDFTGFAFLQRSGRKLVQNADDELGESHRADDTVSVAERMARMTPASEMPIRAAEIIQTKNNSRRDAKLIARSDQR